MSEGQLKPFPLDLDPSPARLSASPDMVASGMRRYVTICDEVMDGRRSILGQRRIMGFEDRPS